MNINPFMRRMALPTTLALTLLGGLSVTAMPTHADGEKCEKAERDRQTAEIDHALGRNSEKDVKDAKEAAEKACHPN